MPFLKSAQLEDAIRSGKIESLYLFDGPEHWLKERAIKNILNTLLAPETKDFNYEKFYGKEVSANRIISSVQSLPFLSSRRVVILEEADELNASDSRLLADALAHVPSTTCLILLVSGKADLREDLPARVISNGSIVTFWPPFPNERPRWIQEETRRRGKTMAIEAAEALADSCGDLQEVSNEIDKLILFIGKKPTITFEDIQDHGLPNESADFKDLEEAIYQRNLKMALNQGRLLAEMGVRAEAIFPLFERIFRNLVLAAYKTEVRGWNHKDLFSQFRLRGRTQQENFMRGLTLYSKEELQGSLALIAEADLNLKTGALSSEVAVTLVILNLLGRARRYPLARAAN